MKTIIYFIGASFISTFALFGALALKHNPWPCFAVAFGIWALFIWGYNLRSKKKAAKRFNERIFENYMRSRVRGPGRQ